jgi:hypothetical protein
MGNTLSSPPVHPLKEAIPPFYRVRILITHKRCACKVPLIVINYAKQPTGTDTIQPCKLRWTSRKGVTAADDRLAKRAEDGSARVCCSTRLPQGQSLPYLRLAATSDSEHSRGFGHWNYLVCPGVGGAAISDDPDTENTASPLPYSKAMNDTEISALALRVVRPQTTDYLLNFDMPRAIARVKDPPVKPINYCWNRQSGKYYISPIPENVRVRAGGEDLPSLVPGINRPPANATIARYIERRGTAGIHTRPYHN